MGTTQFKLNQLHQLFKVEIDPMHIQAAFQGIDQFILRFERFSENLLDSSNDSSEKNTLF